MAWISYEDVRSAAGASGDMTAADIVAALKNHFNDAVKTAHEPSATTVYNSHGFSLKQNVTTTRTECRGLDIDLAERIADGMSYDDTAKYKWSAVYAAKWQKQAYSQLDFDVFEVVAGPLSSTTSSWKYKPGGIGNGISRNIYRPTDGRIVEATASRANDADGWTVVITETVYDVPDNDAGSIFWPASIPPQSSRADYSGNVVSRTTRSQFLFSYGGYTLNETTTTTVTEIRNLTYEQVDSKFGQVKYATWKRAQFRTGTNAAPSYTMAVRDGTETVMDARYVDAEQGWTVVATSTTYGHNTVSSGAGWYLV